MNRPSLLLIRFWRGVVRLLFLIFYLLKIDVISDILVYALLWLLGCGINLHLALLFL